MRKVLGVYSVTGRDGMMIILEGTSDLPFDRRLVAKVYSPGKEVREVAAIKDRPHPPSLALISSEGFLLVGMDKTDLEGGTLVEISCDVT